MAHYIGRQDRMQMSAHKEQERMVLKAVGMIVHILTVEEKRSISRPRYIAVPDELVGWCIASYREHGVICDLRIYFFYDLLIDLLSM